MELPAAIYTRFCVTAQQSTEMDETSSLSYDRAMKHAGAAALDELRDLLAAVRTRGGLREPRHGVFYRKGKAWLHFHEDKAGLFADLRAGTEWERFRVSDPGEREGLLAAIDQTL
jgi:hypothetical protein